MGPDGVRSSWLLHFPAWYVGFQLGRSKEVVAEADSDDSGSSYDRMLEDASVEGMGQLEDAVKGASPLAAMIAAVQAASSSREEDETGEPGHPKAAK